MTKCMPNDTNGVHLYAKVWNLYAKVWHIYYINVRQSVEHKKKYAIVALVWEKAEFRDHSTTLNREREIKVDRKKDY